MQPVMGVFFATRQSCGAADARQYQASRMPRTLQNTLYFNASLQR
jgi:hypothetical protein